MCMCAKRVTEHDFTMSTQLLPCFADVHGRQDLHLKRRWEHDDSCIDVLQPRQQADQTRPSVSVVCAGLDEVCAQQWQCGT